MSHSREDILNLLNSNDHAVCRAVVAIYRRQTATEQSQWATVEQNGKGFTAADASYCTRIAKLLLAGKALTTQQLEETRCRMRKYAGQLVTVAIENSLRQLCNRQPEGTPQ